ncbi:hypothetical protein IF1G_07899 [Cordyceps javanica]|uniref:Uncharacterized protein n=1 Tax=Cordyceps javanica TaxID=43265 RepID=A0A545UV27_9HYPO|nr:hypothetical protein IF1G_07899 [Cordyceps javanica]
MPVQGHAGLVEQLLDTLSFGAYCFAEPARNKLLRLIRWISTRCILARSTSYSVGSNRFFFARTTAVLSMAL